MKKKIKVFLGGYVNFLNAQNINCRALSKHLDKEKFDVWTIHFWYENASDFEVVSGVHYLKSIRPKTLFGWVPYFRGLLKCDVAYLPKGEYIYLCRFLGRILHCRIFSTIEGLISGTNLEKVKSSKYGLEAYKVFQPNVYAITHTIREQVARDHGIPTNEKVLYLGVEAGRFENSRRQEGKALCNVVFIGNNIQYKGIEDFLRLAESFLSVQFHCIGGNKMREGLLETYIQQHGLRNVTYHGLLDHSQMAKLLESIDLMFFPSRSEGFPKVILETASAGVPTVCYSDYGADEWITTGKNGFVVDTYEEACAVIQNLIDNPGKLASLSKAAVELGRSFDWNVLVKTWEEEIEKLANEK